MGEEMEAPSDAPIVDFMEWLANEPTTMSDYMTVGREYASPCLRSGFGRVWV